MPQKFTTRFVESLKPTINEQTYADSDSALSIRTLKSGAYYFFRNKRFGKKQIGRVGTISLAEASEVANEFKSLTRKGINPNQKTKKIINTAHKFFENLSTGFIFCSHFSCYLNFPYHRGRTEFLSRPKIQCSNPLIQARTKQVSFTLSLRFSGGPPEGLCTSFFLRTLIFTSS